MSQLVKNTAGTEQDRQRRLAEMVAEEGVNWCEPYRPGSFGCHELLDRTSILGDLLEQHLLSHPACIANPQWFDLATQAVTALRELYQQIGSEHD